MPKSHLPVRPQMAHSTPQRSARISLTPSTTAQAGPGRTLVSECHSAQTCQHSQASSIGNCVIVMPHICGQITILSSPFHCYIWFGESFGPLFSQMISMANAPMSDQQAPAQQAPQGEKAAILRLRRSRMFPFSTQIGPLRLSDVRSITCRSDTITAGVLAAISVSDCQNGGCACHRFCF